MQVSNIDNTYCNAVSTNKTIDLKRVSRVDLWVATDVAFFCNEGHPEGSQPPVGMALEYRGPNHWVLSFGDPSVIVGLLCYS